MKLTRLATLVILFSSSFAQAQASNESGLVPAIRDVFRYTDEMMAPIPQGHFADAGETTQANACKAAYDDFYSKPDIQFNVTLGYADMKPQRTYDFAAYTAWVEKLKRPCTRETGATCGFKIRIPPTPT